MYVCGLQILLAAKGMNPSKAGKPLNLSARKQTWVPCKSNKNLSSITRYSSLTHSLLINALHYLTTYFPLCKLDQKLYMLFQTDEKHTKKSSPKCSYIRPQEHEKSIYGLFQKMLTIHRNCSVRA